jgi:hypothetical protein
MLQFFTFLFLLSIDPANSEEIKCPEESMLVDFVVSFSKERMQSCQKKVGDKFLKHGAEIIYNTNGSVKSKKYYLDDVLSEEPSISKKSENDQKNEIKKEIDRIIDIFSEHVLVGAIFSKQIDIFKGGGRCHESSLERMQFVMKGIPYTNKVAFNRQCFFDGEFRYEFDKKLKAIFKVNNVFGYDRLEFDYLLSKNTSDGGISLSTEVLSGEFKSNTKKLFKFKALVGLKINLESLITSGGKTGISIESATVDIIEYDGKPFSHHRELI